MPGTRVGPYEVVAVIGAGGMAEVYRAKDTRLNREIALKVVNDEMGANPELVRRFEQAKVRPTAARWLGRCRRIRP